MPKSSEHDTTYEIAAHSIVKHKILEKYLGPWFFVLSKYDKTVQYIDCFAGSGEYENPGVRGSPIIALDSLTNHSLCRDMLSRSTFNFVFIESKKERATILENTIRSRNLPDSVKVTVITEIFQKVMEELYGTDDSPRYCNLCATFAFIDPFGYSHIPMKYVRRILETSKCEVMINLMVNNAKRNAFAGESLEKSLDDLFGCHDWIGVRDIPEERKEERNQFLADLYVRELTKNLNDDFKFTLQFKMIGNNGHEAYRLVFATKHSLGNKLMKEAMWDADPNGTFTFDDRRARQTYLMQFFDEKPWMRDAANHLYKSFRGSSKSREEIETFVYDKTVWVYRGDILKILEAEDRIVVENRKKRNTYPEGCKITFKA